MNIFRGKPIRLLTTIFSMLVSIAILSACGGSGGGSDTTAGIGGTGIAVGKVTDFGSVFVNGRIFNTDMSKFIVDGDPNASQSDLAIGMVIFVKAETNNGTFTGKALEVVYDDEIQGPVAALPALVAGESQRTFTVFGQTVTIDDTDTLFQGAPGNPGFGFDTISNNDVVEVSGFRTAANAISASYVEWKDSLAFGSEVELRGTITGYNPGPLPPESFSIVGAPGITITTDGSTVEDLISGALQDGLYVEVKGEYQDATTVLAKEIEEEDEDFGDDIDEISLQGVISNYLSNSNFEIDGQLIDASGANPFPANALSLLDDGVEVEVEGDIDIFGKLIADELELRGGDSELRTTIKGIDSANKRLELEYPGQPMGAGLGTVWVKTDGQTLFEDESAANLPDLSFGQLAIGNFVKVKGIADMGEVNAEIVKRLDPDSTKLQGVVEAFERDVSITILGVEYPIDAFADYEDEAGNTMTNVEFFDQLDITPNAVVELEDDEPDADADEVEFDD
jgi:hypothetical protein